MLNIPVSDINKVESIKSGTIFTVIFKSNEIEILRYSFYDNVTFFEIHLL